MERGRCINKRFIVGVFRGWKDYIIDIFVVCVLVGVVIGDIFIDGVLIDVIF